jgi:hypothetical protein
MSSKSLLGTRDALGRLRVGVEVGGVVSGGAGVGLVVQLARSRRDKTAPMAVRMRVM